LSKKNSAECGPTKSLDFIARSKLSVAILKYKYLLLNISDSDLLKKITAINVEEILIDEMEELTAFINAEIKIIEVQVKVFSKKISIADDKKELSDVAKELDEEHRAINTKKASLEKLEEYLAILLELNAELDRILETKTNWSL